MGATAQRAALVLGIGLAFAGCGATDSGGATDAARRVYEGYSRDDGAAACATLSDDAREQLEQDERKPCAEAVLELKLSGTRATAEEAYVTEAKVDLDAGDSVFLEETGDGWRVSAAGCPPSPGRESPYDCGVES